MTLYLKYRPKVLAELDLDEVRESLKNIVISGNIPHALLFSGPKGLGKTSAARILAKIINCKNLSKGEPCNKCVHCKAIDAGSHLDVIEMDAASNRGIDDIRILREAVKLAPSVGSHKVYIIDEAHMLTTEASNALLKTLEEPPTHVTFVLATTNPEKLIDTIRSRTTNINFRKPTHRELLKSLRRVVKGEGLKAKEEVLDKIIESADGSFRDAVKHLETLVMENKLDSPGNIASQARAVTDLVDLVFQKDTKGSIEKLKGLMEIGISIDVVTQRLLGACRNELLASVGVLENKKSNLTKSELVRLIEIISVSIKNIANSPVEELPLEVALVKWGGKATTFTKVESAKVEEGEEKKIEKVKMTKPIVAIADTQVELVGDTWARILNLASPKNKSIEALLRSAKPINFDGSVLTLGVYYSFHKERLEAAPHRQMLDEIIKEVFGKNIKVICTLTTPPPVEVQKVKSQEGVVLTEKNLEVSDVLTGESEADIIKLAKDMFS